jgi:hypothetical protein
MKRSIMIKWTCSEQIDLDIPDGKMTDEEIEKAVDLAAEAIMPQYPDDWEWEWASAAPVAKDAPLMLPPDNCWVESKSGYTAATDGYMVLIKDCPVTICSPHDWRKLKDSGPIDQILSVNFQSLPLHRGWFKKRFEPFKDFKVVGNTPRAGFNGNACLGYVLDGSDNLIAVLLPATYTEGDRDEDLHFQFNPDEVK